MMQSLQIFLTEALTFMCVKLVAVNDAALGEIVRRELYADFVAWHQLDAIHAKLPCNVSHDRVTIFQTDAKLRAWKSFVDKTTKLDDIFT